MSSVGQGLGAVVGGVVGFFTLGGPTGALQGASYGAAIGGILDPADLPGYEGPRLSDASEQTSGYGVGLVEFDGKTRISPHCIWIENNKRREVVRKEEVGGKGGGSQESTTYEYYGTAAFLIADHEVQAIERGWTSLGLLFNTAATDVDTAMSTSKIFPLAHLYNSNTQDQLKAALQVNPSPGPKGEIRLYPGFDDQMPDPRMEADLGVGNCPAYRGCAMLVIYDFPLPQEYGQSIAGIQLSLEVIRNGDDGAAVLINEIGFDEFSGYRYPFCYYLTPSLSRPYFEEITASVLTDPPQAFKSLDVGAHSNQVTNPTYSGSLLIADGYSQGRGLTDEDIGPIGHWQQSSLISSFPGRANLTNAGRFVRKGNRWYGVAGNGGDIFVGDEGLDSYDSATPTRTVYAIAVNDDDELICICNNYIDIYDNTLTLQSSIDTTGAFGGGLAGYGYVWAAFDSGTLYVGKRKNNHPVDIYPFDMATGTDGNVISLRDMSVVYSSPDESTANFNVAGSILTRFSSNLTNPSSNPYDAFIEHYRLPTPGADGEDLATVVRRRIERCELIEPADLDVTDLSGTVRGYKTQGVGSVAQRIEPLMLSHQFDLVMSGYQLKAITRGKSSVMTIDPDDLDARSYGTNPGVALSRSREMDTQLPSVVVVKCPDKDRDYEINEQRSQTQAASASVNIREVVLTEVFTPTEAAGIAETLWSRAWLERIPFKFSLPQTYRALEAADVVTLTTDDGTYELYLNSVNYTLDNRVEIESVFNDSAIYTPNAVGGAGQVSTTIVPYGGNSVLHLLDIPLIQDAYDTPGYPVAMCGYSPTWPGGVVVKSSDDGQTWQPVQGFSGDVISGVVPTALSADDGYRIDRTNTMTVTLNNSGMSISSITEAQMLSGQHWAAYGVHGRWEIIQFANVTDNGDGTITLDTLVRGAKGTEWATGLHEAYDYFVFISDADTAFLNVEVGAIGVQRYFRGITNGQDIDDVSNQLYTYSGENLTPLSVVRPTASWSSGEVTIDAEPRSRLSGSWWDTGVSTSHGEVTESYEIDILNGSTVVRTLTGGSFPIVYSAANHVADFGSLQSTLDVEIYQVSAVVGRGRVCEATFTNPENILSATHPDLVALWDVANVSGSSWPDSSINGYDATITGASVVSDALVFTGSGDYARVPSGLERSLTQTFVIKFEIDSLAASGIIYQSSDWADEGSTYNGVVIDVRSDGRIGIGYGDGGTPGTSSRRTKLTAASTVTTGTEYFLIAEIEGATNMTITLDNSDAGGTYSGTGGPVTQSGTYDGKFSGVSVTPFVGKIRGKVRIYDRALTTEEKTTLYNEA